MQKDFHFCAIKVLAREAGYGEDEAQTLAYASQYVDDAVEHQPLRIDGMTPALEKLLDYPAGSSRLDVAAGVLDPTCTAHSGISYLGGLAKDVRRKVYLAFHFVPPRRAPGPEAFAYRVLPGGSLPRALVDAALDRLRDAGRRPTPRVRALIQLGIALHAYADTWAHQGFSGRWSAQDNDIGDIETNRSGVMEAITWGEKALLNVAPDIGHLEAGSFPDLSNLRWRYQQACTGALVERDNAEIFLEAARAIHGLLCASRARAQAWERLRPRLQACFLAPASRTFVPFRRAFPGTTFDYDPGTWRREALAGPDFDWAHFDADDYQTRRYTLRPEGNLKWFLFQREAYAQRVEVLASLPQA